MKTSADRSPKKRSPRAHAENGSKAPGSARTTARRARGGKKPGLFKRLPWLRHVLVVLGLIGVGLFFLYREVDLQTLQARAMDWNAGLVFALLAVLPLFGFPVNVLHVTAGLRFGFALGMTLVALSILFQLVASYAIVHLWHDTFARHLAGVRKRIPRAAHGTVCLFTLLLPGVPYFIQNYTLALIGVPFRIYISRCLPLHILRAVLTVGLGQQAGKFTRGGLAALATYWVLVLCASWWAYRRLRRQLADQPAVADGQTQPA